MRHLSVVIELPEGDFKLARESEARWDSEICHGRPGCPGLISVQRLGNDTKIYRRAMQRTRLLVPIRNRHENCLLVGSRL